MEADKIVNKRSDERDREYGGFSQGMIKTAKIATELCNKEITTEDCFKILMALKLSRLSHSAKFDSMTDLIGYTEGWWNFLQEETEPHKYPTSSYIKIKCPDCGGSCFDLTNDMAQCERCDGNGYIIYSPKN